MLEVGAELPANKKKAKQCLQKALKNEEYRVAERLIQAGADPKDLTLKSGDTPLHAAFYIALYKDEGTRFLFLMVYWQCVSESAYDSHRFRSRIGRVVWGVVVWVYGEQNCGLVVRYAC